MSDMLGFFAQTWRPYRARRLLGGGSRGLNPGLSPAARSGRESRHSLSWYPELVSGLSLGARWGKDRTLKLTVMGQAPG
jgi:hypothetical protein